MIHSHILIYSYIHLNSLKLISTTNVAKAVIVEKIETGYPFLAAIIIKGSLILTFDSS